MLLILAASALLLVPLLLLVAWEVLENYMASNQTFRDLNWALQALQSGNINLHSIAFHHFQPTSNCYLETENSLNINISGNSDGISFFVHILNSLSASKGNHESLNNLGFYDVEWDVQQMQYLNSILENYSCIKQLTFQRNVFDVEELSEFSDMLKRNEVLKEVVFAESGIGRIGAGLLASALKRNECLEELQIWDDSIGSRGAEKLAEMIEVNNTLKLLIILDSQSITAAPLISAVLARSRAMEVHVWCGESKGKNSKVVEFAPENNTLRIYRLDSLGSQRVACAMGWNSTVKTLDMTGIQLGSQWAKEFRGVLELNTTLKHVILSRTCLKDKGVLYVAAGLFKNRTLQTLQLDGNWFSGAGVERLLCPLSRFSALQRQANITLKSLSFGGGKTKFGREGMTAVLQMLVTNESITWFGIHDDEKLRSDDFVKIFRNLEKNATLKHLSLKGCRGVQGEQLLQTIMDTLQVNPWIESIDLCRTPLENDGKADVIYQKLGQIRKMEPEMDLLEDMSLVMPKSCRVFLCGQEYAGKTTLCNSIMQNFCSSKLPYMDQMKTLVNPVEQAVRTVGIQIKTVQGEDTKISIWDLAGQHEFYAFHDLMFPGHGSPSFFLIICSLFRKPDNREQKSPAEVEEDLLYWLRFIVSNSRRAPSQLMLPNISVILTHVDKITLSSENLQATVNLIQKLKERFSGFVEFYPTVFTVDARSSSSVGKLTHHLRKTSKTILQRAPRIYSICNDLIENISDWRTVNYNRPVMNWKEFSELCQLKVPALRIRSRHDNFQKVEMRRQGAASTLHHMGEVIFFEELGYLILDCEWFCEVLGRLVRLDATKHNLADSGFLSRKELEKILRGSLQSRIPGMGPKVFENVGVNDLVQMMLKLELCYEQDHSDPNSLLLIPAILREGRGRPQKWQLSTPDCVYVGRHLECDDSSHMFLTPGFFPRVQVHLHNKMFGSNNPHAATYSLEKYLISVTINGIQIRVELGGQMGFYIDVLACSTKNTTEMLRLFHQFIIPTIQGLCQGVILIEHVLRPDCVKNLIPPRHRKTQFVALQQLKRALLTVPADSMYDYQHTWISVMDGGCTILPSGFDYARNLLSEDDFREVINRRYHDLYNLAMELAVPTDNTQTTAIAETNTDGTVEPSMSGIAKGVEQVLQRLKIIEQEIKDIKQEIQGLRYYEHRLLIELHRKVDYMVNYSAHLEEKKVPRMFYFVHTENYSRKLITTMISGMTALRLHMLCEFRREMHVVQDQQGCEVLKIDNQAVRSLAPYMSKFMKLLTFALKIGAHMVAGMGGLIPDLSREVVQLMDSSAFYGGEAMAAGAAGAVGVAAAGQIFGSRNRTMSRAFGGEDLKAAQQWLVDFLKERKCSSGKDIAEKFGLWRVRYRDDGQIAWVCRWHREVRSSEIMEVPM